MRGQVTRQVELFSFIPLEARVPEKHPLRPIRDLVDEVLVRMSADFDRLYSSTGRPSIPPEQLLKALLLQVLFTIRSELQIMEHIRFNLLYRWFVGLAPDEEVWDPTTFTKNRERLLAGDIANTFFEEVLSQARSRDLVSDDHFTVDGTLIEAWAGQKSFQPKESEKKEGPGGDDKDEKNNQGPRNPDVNFHGQKRTNETHESKTDPECRLYKKSSGSEAKLCYLGHVIMENRNGLVVEACITQATGRAEREAAYDMAEDLPGSHRKTLGGDKNYDTREFVDDLQNLAITPHVAQNNKNRSSAIDARTTRHPGYAVSQQKRKRVEEIFGWAKTVGPMRKTHFRGQKKVGWMFMFALSVYNLVRIRNLTVETA